jgi:8-oxo-dGTP pyrophosphatase MutT (NUDIX family)
MISSLSEETAGWPPEKAVFPVAHVDVRVLAGDHPFRSREEEAIRLNWERETAANPALFDGGLVFQHRMTVSEQGIESDAYLVPFSTFMWWRRKQERQGGFHLFAYPVLVGSDNTLVAIRMGKHTANPGQVYFAAGSLEECDIVDGRVDLEGNMRREVLEETGLDLRDAMAENAYHATHFRRSVTVFRLFRFAMTGEALAAEIERHIPVAEDQEIEGAVVIRSADPAAQPYNVAMLPILDWFFEKRR